MGAISVKNKSRRNERGYTASDRGKPVDSESGLIFAVRCTVREQSGLKVPRVAKIAYFDALLQLQV